MHKTKKELVYVVDDDDSVRNSLKMLLESADYNAICFSSGNEFLKTDLSSEGPQCLVLDVRMPGFSGMELQQELKRREIDLPIIFVSGHGDIPMSVEAIRQGALTFLPKPFDDEELIESIREALDKDAVKKNRQAMLDEMTKKFEQLSEREIEVLRHLIQGKLNKQVAAALKISERTVKAHRKSIHDKLEVRSMAELVRFTETIGVEPSI